MIFGPWIPKQVDSNNDLIYTRTSTAIYTWRGSFEFPTTWRQLSPSYGPLIASHRTNHPQKSISLLNNNIELSCTTEHFTALRNNYAPIYQQFAMYTEWRNAFITIGVFMYGNYIRKLYFEYYTWIVARCFKLDTKFL